MTTAADLQTKLAETKAKIDQKNAEYRKEQMQKSEVNLVKVNEQSLMTVDQLLDPSMVMVGMSHVPMTDIRPPSILIRQKMSEESQYVDNNGKTAQLGQYFHTGKLEVMDEFDAYIVYAAKGKWINKRKNNEEWDKYTAIGLMKDASLFGMTFKSTSLFTLSSLFTATQAQKKPMFAFNVHFDKTKKLENEQGAWYNPFFLVVHCHKVFH